MDLETKFSKVEAEAVTTEGVISGYASLFGVEDLGGDVVVAGAFAKSLESRHPKLLWDHDPGAPIGAWTSVKEDGKGLRVEGRLAMGTVKGREAHELLRMGAIDGLSIGFRTVKSARQGNARLIQEATLHEISVVSIPMLESAKIDTVKTANEILEATKSGDFSPLKRAVEKAMRDAGFPAWLAKAQASLAPQALSDGSRDASASEIAKLIKDSFKV